MHIIKKNTNSTKDGLKSIEISVDMIWTQLDLPNKLHDLFEADSIAVGSSMGQSYVVFFFSGHLCPIEGADPNVLPQWHLC